MSGPEVGEVCAAGPNASAATVNSGVQRAAERLNKRERAIDSSLLLLRYAVGADDVMM
jgi:hypothetical protein